VLLNVVSALTLGGWVSAPFSGAFVLSSMSRPGTVIAKGVENIIDGMKKQG
jgi:hypothetical protein